MAPKINFNELLLDQTLGQTAQEGFVKVTDPKIKIWDSTIPGRYMCYFPVNPILASKLPDGSLQRGVKALVHSLTKRGKFDATLRCTNGLVLEAHGFTGVCPACSSLNESWDYYKEKLEQLARDKGVDVNTLKLQKKDNKQLESLLSGLNSEREVREAKGYQYLPMVKLEGSFDATGKDFIVQQGPDGKPMYTIYIIRFADFTLDKLNETLVSAGEDFFGTAVVLNYSEASEKRQITNSVTIAARSGFAEKAKPLIDLIENDPELLYFTPLVINSGISELELLPYAEAFNKVEAVLKPSREAVKLAAAVRESITANTGAKKEIGTNSAEEIISGFRTE